MCLRSIIARGDSVESMWFDVVPYKRNMGYGGGAGGRHRGNLSSRRSRASEQVFYRVKGPINIAAATLLALILPARHRNNVGE